MLTAPGVCARLEFLVAHIFNKLSGQTFGPARFKIINGSEDAAACKRFFRYGAHLLADVTAPSTSVLADYLCLFGGKLTFFLSKSGKAKKFICRISGASFFAFSAVKARVCRCFLLRNATR